jgi:hypothetical protein
MSYRTFVMPWGKYKGKTLDEIAALRYRPYLEWAANRCDDKRVRAAATQYLESTAAERSSPLLTMPKPIAASPELSPGAKLVFGAIFTAADQDPEERCRLPNPAIEAQTGLSGKQVKRLLVELEANGLIARVGGASRLRQIAVTWTTA